VSIQKPKFQVGDEVIVLNNIITSEDGLAFTSEMKRWTRKTAIIKDIIPIGGDDRFEVDNEEPWYFFDDCNWMWAESWLKFVKKGKKPKFKVGEWVVLKEDIKLVGNDGTILWWKRKYLKKFMKINRIIRHAKCIQYAVNENSSIWDEVHLKKVK
jgi:hypothetical protein